MQDVCISDPVTLRVEVASDLPRETVALRLLVGIAQRCGMPERSTWQMVNEAFALAEEFLHQCRKEKR